MYLRNSKSFIPTQAVPIPRGRPGALKSPGGAPRGTLRGFAIPRGAGLFAKLCIMEKNEIGHRFCFSFAHNK